LNTSIVTKGKDVADLAARARSAGRIGFDTEFMRERTYHARLCLVQIATVDEISLIDAVGETDLSPVAELLADESVQIVVHAGRQDFEIFNHNYGCIPRNIFDVQIAAAFAGYGGSLPYGRVVHSVLGVSIPKGESYTDWCRRPLTEKQQRYAADDVRHLIGITDRLSASLKDQGRMDWALDEMASLSDPAAYDTDTSEVWKKVSGRGSLSGRQTTVLREIASWREEAAKKRDLPRNWVIKDATLVEVARRMPSTMKEVASIRGMSAGEAERSGKELLAAVERGRQAPEMPAARRVARNIQVRARLLSGLADAIVRARCETAGIATEIVATRGELDAVLIDVLEGSVQTDRHRLLSGWRWELAGEAVVKLARGEIGLKVIEQAPYVEEVPLS
jgi:ribonuclease D